MSTELSPVLIADLETSLATAMAVGATTATLQNNIDDDGVTLPDGLVYLTLDGNNSSKEHLSAVKTGTSLASIKSISRQGVGTSGCVRPHRVGAKVIISDFAHIKKINDILIGTTNLNASTPLGYDGAPTITTGNQLATKTYVDGVAIAGAAKADATTYGISKLSVAAVSAVAPIAVGDNDTRVPSQDENDALAGTLGTPSSTNKYVTNSDPRFFNFSTEVDGTYILDGTQAAVGGLFSKNSSTYTLLKSASFVSLTINSGVVLETNGYKINATTLVNNGTIRNNGTSASGTTAGVGGIGNDLAAGKDGQIGQAGTATVGTNGVNGTSVSPSIGSNGVAGGNGGSATNGGNGGVTAYGGGTGGTAGTATAEKLVFGEFTGTFVDGSIVTLPSGLIFGTLSRDILSASAGSGSGAGGGANTSGGTGGSGGGSGGTGGIVEIISQTITVGATGVISANGGNGGNGAGGGFSQAGFGGGGGGGGGGGSGGSVVLAYTTLTNSGSITASAGTGGSAGPSVQGGSAGAAGTNGIAGKVYKIKI